jgi:4-amino-4-deoxy-L-arabinose transferase-like glycosyltransferase
MFARLQAFFNPANDDASRAPRRIFWTGLIVRLLYITLAHTYRIRPANDHFEFGWEMGRIARALATGHGYADPFEGHTGPTAWTPPLYPLILAAVFKLFGVYTGASAWVILAINSIFSAATAPAVYQIGRRGFRDHKLALWSAWLWALYPAAMQYAVRWVWDMSVTAWLFAWVVVLALHLRAKPQAALRPWLLFGLLWGFIALSNSSLLVFLPFCVLWILWPNPRAALRSATLSALLCVAVISPWVLRNYLVFHAFVPLRSNFGAELYESAQLENEGYPTMATLPHAVASPDFQRYQRLGELAYSREQGAQARQIIRQHPGIWVAHIFRRIWFFWVSVPHPTEGTWRGLLNETLRELSYAFLSLSGLLGLALALRNKIPAAWLYFWAFVSIPLLYYAITVQARFRHPLEPVICVLAVYLFRSAKLRRPRIDG